MRFILKFLFSLAIIGGTLTGWAFTRAFQSPSPAEVIQPIQGQLPGQVNVLVIGVDDLENTTPILQSIWLVIYRADTAQLDFLPVYPVHPAMGLLEYEAPHSPIAWDALTTSPASLPVVAAQKLHWDESITIDQHALYALLGYLQQSGAPQASEASLFMERYPIPWEAPSASRYVQESLVRYLCEQRATISTSAGSQVILANMSDHMVSSLNSTSFQLAWQSLANSSSGLTCNFPLSEE